MNMFPGRITADYQLEDRFDRHQGRVYMTGTQALVRILLDQARRDRETGLNTAGFVSGYRGSPLGGVDLELWRAGSRLERAGIEFLPAVNEDLAATAVLGSQQVETNPQRRYDGVYAMWYGKGPGVDRAGDALKHGNAYGCSQHGGVLVVAGDDHGCVSSSMPHQSDVAFMAWFMPTLNPASVSEYLAFGEYGYALSRFSGMWVGFKAVSETVEAAASFELRADRKFDLPDFEPPPGGVHYRWPDLPGPQIEERMEAKKNAVFAFAEANPIDRHIYDVPKAKFGIVTTGKGHLDLMEALRLLGVDETACRRLGIDIYKVGMVWPLARRDALDFVRGKREILVIEEKRGIIESQFKEYFYDWPGDKPERMVGKRDQAGNRLVPWTGELSPRLLLPIVAGRLDGIFPDENFSDRAQQVLAGTALPIVIEGATRTPYFCSGCPHNTSTKVPEGSQALAGIGCHFMASWMDRSTTSLIQMGGEGVNWAASSRFTGMGHVFQNLGEGTWYHSGSMAIRQAIAAKANITYKILYNDAVAMTGGQPVDGPVSVQAIAQTCRAEGVERIALVSDNPEKFATQEFPAGTTIHDRGEMDELQRQMREIQGVSVLIYEQTCATEKRRRRKRGEIENAKRFAIINELVCEGCGDCSVESNCLSVEPIKTPLGTKRRINQSTCNTDFSCVNGFCPSFVTVEGVRRKSRAADATRFVDRAEALLNPELPQLEEAYDLLITGVGGTGVVTVGALITMAAHLENKNASVLDFTGFAQKFGPVLSFVRLANGDAPVNQVRIDTASADALIGCDIVVSSSPKASATYRHGMKTVLNMAEMPTGDILRIRDASLRTMDRRAAIEAVAGRGNVASFDANRLAEREFGDTVFANVILLGAAWQNGLVPISHQALMWAIELNGAAVETNKQAFAFGRLVAADPGSVEEVAPGWDDSIDDLIERFATYLRDYRDAAYADRYLKTVSKVRGTEARLKTNGLTEAVARSLFRLMAIKDEYEVARLHRDGSFLARLEDEFEPGFKVSYHLAPPLLSGDLDARGRPRKWEFGSWIGIAFSTLKRVKGLRGGMFDIFGHTAERKMERELIGWYEALVDEALSRIDETNGDEITELLALGDQIRGYGQVKEEAVERVKAEVEEGLARL